MQKMFKMIADFFTTMMAYFITIIEPFARNNALEDAQPEQQETHKVCICKENKDADTDKQASSDDKVIPADDVNSTNPQLPENDVSTDSSKELSLSPTSEEKSEVIADDENMPGLTENNVATADTTEEGFSFTAPVLRRNVTQSETSASLFSEEHRNASFANPILFSQLAAQTKVNIAEANYQNNLAALDLSAKIIGKVGGNFGDGSGDGLGGGFGDNQEL